MHQASLLKQFNSDAKKFGWKTETEQGGMLSLSLPTLV